MNIKKKILISISQLFFLTGFTAPARCGRGRLSIVTFHRVLSKADRQNYPFTGLAVTPEELDAFLTYFTAHFDCGTLATQHGRYLSGEKTVRPLLAITFDDAQYDNYSNARPVLARHKVRASFFAPVVAVEQQELLWHDRLGFAIFALLKLGDRGREQVTRLVDAAGLSAKGPNSLVSNIVAASKSLTLEARLHLVETLVEASGATQAPSFARLMTFEELAELAVDGHEIGSHSMTHCMMPECTDSALDYELAESRRVLQAHLGLPIESFCYPNGNSDARAADAVARAGYLRAVTTNWGSNGLDADRFQMHRYDMVSKRVQDESGRFVPAFLAFRMSGYYPGLP
jgi:peptidoglycan/xylan/chitin deacetylase (PgdA/CDA1 family)